MFNEEEFNSIAYAYRAWPESDPQGVVDRYNELLAYVKQHTSIEWLYGSVAECKSEPIEEIIRNLYAGYTIGWMCPKCSRVNSPNSMSCPCVPMVVSCGRLGQTFTLD